jgi:hypothetical protein
MYMSLNLKNYWEEKKKEGKWYTRKSNDYRTT